MADPEDARRCWDCLSELAPDADRFAVLRQTLEAPDELVPAINDPANDALDVRLARAMLFNPVFVCADCAGWYGDHAIRFTAE